MPNPIAVASTMPNTVRRMVLNSPCRRTFATQDCEASSQRRKNWGTGAQFQR